MEFLLLKRLDETRWETLVKPGRRAKTGARFSFGDGALTAVVEESTKDGGRIVRFAFDGIWEEVLDRAGQIPLPPYITEELKDPERYQTVYSKEEGSAAAPTAGLHFTPELLQKAEEKGVKIVEVLLHVGLGTFRPVKAEDISKHHMHAEYYEVGEENAQAINACRAAGGGSSAWGRPAAGPWKPWRTIPAAYTRAGDGRISSSPRVTGSRPWTR